VRKGINGNASNLWPGRSVREVSSNLSVEVDYREGGFVSRGIMGGDLFTLKKKLTT